MTTDNPSGSTGQNVTTTPTINRVAPGGSRPWTDTEQVRLAVHAMKDAAGMSPDDLDVYQAISLLAVQRDAAIRERDEARAALCEMNGLNHRVRIVLSEAGVSDIDHRGDETVEASTDQMVAALRAERDALAAKLADINRTIAEVDMGEVRAAHAEADAANKRAAALAEALREIHDETTDPRAISLARAALAGNGNGTGEGAT